MSLAIPSHALVHSRLLALGHGRYEAVEELARRGAPDFISGSLIVAIGMRESWCKNIAGDGGHGRGWLQIDDRSHAAWLRAHAGCKSGSWDFAHGHHAIDHGYVPGCSAGASLAIDLLHGNYQYLRSHGHASKAGAIAAYNCGAGNALAGARRGNVDLYTTGRDYSHWVLQVQPVVVDELRKLGWFKA
jgi:hypothetical protein